MVNKVIDAVARNIRNEFGQMYKIYINEVEQGLTKPCFLINLTRQMVRQGLKNRQYLVNYITIQYFSEGRDVSRQMYDVSQRLLSVMNFIEIDGKLVRGTNMNFQKTGSVFLSGKSTKYESIDGILDFRVNYNFHIAKKEDSELMENLQQDYNKFERNDLNVRNDNN